MVSGAVYQQHMDQLLIILCRCSGMPGNFKETAIWKKNKTL